MISDLSRHPNHYSVLALVVSVALLLFVIAWPVAVMQMAIVMIAAAVYVVWGLVHHHMTKDLHADVILEYVIMAVLVVSVFWSFLMM